MQLDMLERAVTQLSKASQPLTPSPQMPGCAKRGSLIFEGGGLLNSQIRLLFLITKI